MDILYVVGTGSKWDNNELRYSLRSIEKNCSGIDRVFLVGYKPDFVNENEVGYIFCKDKYAIYKHKNIHDKVKTAIKSGLLNNEFLILSDDHFYCKPTDFNNYPIYYSWEQIPSEVPEGRKPGLYWNSIFATRKLLVMHNLPIYNTSLHCAKHINAELMMANEALFMEGLKLRCGAEINLLMGNLMIANGSAPVNMQDCKFRDSVDMISAREKINNRHVFSTSDEAIQLGIGDILQEMFPDKSRYEI